jgi:hypothetical protein
MGGRGGGRRQGGGDGGQRVVLVREEEHLGSGTCVQQRERFTTWGVDQCCGSGMFIPDHDFYPFRIPDPTTALKRRGKTFFDLLFLSFKYHKIVNNFIFEQVKNFL